MITVNVNPNRLSVMNKEKRKVVVNFSFLFCSDSEAVDPPIQPKIYNLLLINNIAASLSQHKDSLTLTFLL